MHRPPQPASATLTFEVLGELGHGGMARVDLARLADGDGRLVAVKRPHAHLAKDREFVQMFLDEAWVTGMIQHPNVVGLVGWGLDGEGMFLATEFVAGVSLATLMKQTSGSGEVVAPEIVAYVGTQVASGLAAAHAARDERGKVRGVVHRDISPGNILVAFDGSVKITDFGIAKALASKAETATGILKGKICYIAPEYADGGAFDGRADLFSLGVVLYELSCGGRPFEGKNEVDTLRLLLTADPTPLVSRGNVDKDLAKTIDRLVARDPNARPASGKDIEHELASWLERHSFDPFDVRRRLGEMVEACGARRRQQVLQLTQSRAHPVGPSDDAGHTGHISEGSIITVHTRKTPKRVADTPSHGTRRIADAAPRGTRRVVLEREPAGAFAVGEKVIHRRRVRWAALALLGAVVGPTLAFAMLHHPSSARVATMGPVEEAGAAQPPSAPGAEPAVEPLVQNVAQSIETVEVVASADPPPQTKTGLAWKKARVTRAPKVPVSSSAVVPAPPKPVSCNPHDFNYDKGQCVP